MGNFKRRIMMLYSLQDLIQDPYYKTTFLNIIRYYSSMNHMYQEKYKELYQQVEQPMKEINKLMNWHFEDIINLKMNIEKLYRGINRCKKKQQEIMDLKIEEQIIVSQRTLGSFQSIENLVQNIQQIVQIDPNQQLKKINKSQLEKLIASSQILSLVDVSYFRIIPYQQLVELLNQKPLQNIYYDHLDLGKSLEQFIDSYLERALQIKDQKLNFKLRMVSDFLEDSNDLIAYRRVQIDQLFSYRLIFENLKTFDIDQDIFKYPQQFFKTEIQQMIEKINLRQFKLVDIIKKLKLDQKFHHNLPESLQEKLIGYFFGFYFKYQKFSVLCSKVISQSENIFKLLYVKKSNMKELLFYIDFYGQLDKLNEQLSSNDIQNLELLSKQIKNNQILNRVQFDNSELEFLNEKIEEFNQQSKTDCEKITQLPQQYQDMIIQYKKNLREIEKSEKSNIFDLQIKIMKKNNQYLKSIFEFLKIMNTANFSEEIKSFIQVDLQSKILFSLNFIYKINKFLYIMGITFSNLLYNGFCVSKEEQQKEQIEGDEELEFGTGMGEGSGQENVTNELQYEEQVLGEMRDDEENSEDKDQNNEEEDQMEMENDFDGQNEKQNEKEQEENKDKNQNNLDDEFDDVSEEDLDPKLHKESDDEEEEEEQENQEANIDLEKEQINNQQEELKAKEEKEQTRQMNDQEEPQDQSDNDQDNNENQEEEQNLEEEQNQEEKEFHEEDYQESFNEEYDNEEQNQNQDMEEEQIDINDQSIEIEEDNNQDIEEEVDIQEMEEEQIDDEQIDQKQEQKQEQNIPDINQQESGQQENQNNNQEQQQEEQQQQGANEQDEAKEQLGQDEYQEAIKEYLMDDNNNNIEEILQEKKLQQKQEENQNDFKEEVIDQVEVTQNSHFKQKAPFKSQKQNEDINQEDYQKQKYENILQQQFLNFEEENLEKRSKLDEQQNESFKKQPLMNRKMSQEDVLQMMENFSNSKRLEEIVQQSDFLTVLQESRLFISKEANKLCEQLKSILEQKSMSSLKGDFRTGKKLNMKKIIPYIASNYRKDKIWLRKCEPDDKDYKILIGVDNSLSMQEKNVGKLALFSLSILSKAIQKSQIGELHIAQINNNMKLVTSHQNISDNNREEIFNTFTFDYQEKYSMDLQISSFIRDSWRQLFKNSEKKNICFIISDGRTNCEVVRRTFLEEQIRDMITLMKTPL